MLGLLDWAGSEGLASDARPQKLSSPWASCGFTPTIPLNVGGAGAIQLGVLECLMRRGVLERASPGSVSLRSILLDYGLTQTMAGAGRRGNGLGARVVLVWRLRSWASSTVWDC